MSQDAPRPTLTRSTVLRVVAAVTMVVLFLLGREYLLEPFEAQVERPYRGEAAVNPYYALQELYREIGVETESRVRFTPLPPAEGHVVMLLASRYYLRPADVERVLDWVEAGGTLVVAAHPDYEEDLLLDVAGILRLGWGEELDFDDGDETARPDPTSDFASTRPQCSA